MLHLKKRFLLSITILFCFCPFTFAGTKLLDAEKMFQTFMEKGTYIEYHGVSGDNPPYYIPKTSIVYAKFSEKTGMIILYLTDDTELRIILEEDTLISNNNNLIFNK